MIALLLATLLTGSFTEHTFTSSQGSRQYWLYVPSSYDGTEPVPLVVMLHGCTQNAADIAKGTRLNERAEAAGFIVVYPEQPASMNPLKCWNWYAAAHQSRDAGEPAIIAGITQAVLNSHRIDPKRVYLAGISAGAAMANIVAVNYPEQYSALALHSGIAYRAATKLVDARTAMATGGPDPRMQGRLAFEAMSDRARVIPVLIIHGGRDQAVAMVNADQLAQQWLTTYELLGVRLAAREEVTEQMGDYQVTRTVVRDMANRPLIDRLVVAELTHAWSGGSPEGTFTDPKAPDATTKMLRFFELTAPDK